MRKLTCIAVAMTSVLSCNPMHAHGPEFDYIDSQIELIGSDPVYIYADELAFNFANLGWQSLHDGGNLVVGDLIGLEVLDGAPMFGLGSSQFLFFHNGTDFADPGAANLQGLGTTTQITKSNVTSAAITLDSVQLDGSNPTFHAHLGILLSNGATGAYAFWNRMTTSNTSVQSSEPYMLILNNGLDAQGFERAVNDFKDSAVVPEASSVLLLGGVSAAAGLLGLARRSRRRFATDSTK